MRVACAVAAVVIASAVPAAIARADAREDSTVALLPLDAEPRLEIYGQPVASELARALAAAGIAVAVVGPKSTVPDGAQLIVDGTIARGVGETITLSVRIRARVTGAVLAQIAAEAPSLTAIDRAAAEVAARVLPAVRDELARRARLTPAPPTPTSASASASVPAPTPTLRAVVEVGSGDSEPIRAALVELAPIWAAAQRGPAATVAFSPLALALDRDPRAADVPLAHARVRLRVTAADDPNHVLLDRVIATDTVVGDRGQPSSAIASRVAREVLAIASPVVARALSGRAPR